LIELLIFYTILIRLSTQLNPTSLNVDADQRQKSISLQLDDPTHQRSTTLTTQISSGPGSERPTQTLPTVDRVFAIGFVVGLKRKERLLGRALRHKAAWIYDTFISDDALMQVNVGGSQRKEVERNLCTSLQVNSGCFSECSKEVVKLMLKDSFARFKSSPEFQEFLKEADTYRHLNKKEIASANVLVSRTATII
jgi:hypothetical protein